MSSSALVLPREPSRHLLLSTLSDERLAKLAAQGSEPAFAAIYKRFHQEIYRYCQSITGNEQDARDALQEAMIKAMRGLPGEPRKIALKPWLFRIAHNEAVNQMRRRRPTTPLDSIAELPAADRDNDSHERVRELFDDLSALTARQRGALVMRELNGLSYEEIGAALDTSAAGAKQSVYEARLALVDVARGRETDCREVCERISARDRRLLRARGVRAHLASCASCREFEAGIGARSEGLALVSPLPAVAAAGILNQVIGAGAGAGGTGIGLVTAGTSLTALAKLGVAGVIALGVGTVAIETRDSGPGTGGGATAGGAAQPVVLEPAGSKLDSSPASGGSHAAADSPAARGHARTSGNDHRGHNGAGGGGPSDASGGGSGGSTSSPGTSSAASSASPAAGGGSGGGSGGNAGSAGDQGSAATGDPGGDSSPGSSSGGGSSSGTGSSGTPPGQGGTPPGQGGTPPGLGGELPPGQGGTPPGLDGELPPGQGGTPPGLDGVLPPGQGGINPGNGNGPPPGHGGG
ncbi:MAG: hypothetical protein QOI10_1541 [Solirubrobacterales bacterium]|jgi:RNA polymerase sigma factor (sigma-70 family)|nr:hypothetical protein [Solirubrobacterales bacterium]